MRKRKLLARSLAVVLLATVAPLAMAAQTLDLDVIRNQQREIKEAATAGSGPYASMSAAARSDLLAKQAGMLKVLDGKQTADDLNEAERTEVFNTLEWIEAAINDTEADRLICRRERTIGSNRVTRVCRTAAEEARLRDEARRRVLEGGSVLGDR